MSHRFSRGKLWRHRFVIWPGRVKARLKNVWRMNSTVWGWLMGPFVDAWLKVHPEDVARARRFVLGLETHLDDGAVGSISEIFDAEAPYQQRGCVAQAWSVA